MATGIRILQHQMPNLQGIPTFRLIKIIENHLEQLASNDGGGEKADYDSTGLKENIC